MSHCHVGIPIHDPIQCSGSGIDVLGFWVGYGGQNSTSLLVISFNDMQVNLSLQHNTFFCVFFFLGGGAHFIKIKLP